MRSKTKRKRRFVIVSYKQRRYSSITQLVHLCQVHYLAVYSAEWTNNVDGVSYEISRFYLLQVSTNGKQIPACEYGLLEVLSSKLN